MDEKEHREHAARVLEAKANDIRAGSLDGILLVVYSEKWTPEGDASVFKHLPMFPKTGDGTVRFLVALEKLKLQLLLEHLKDSWDLRKALKEIIGGD